MGNNHATKISLLGDMPAFVRADISLQARVVCDAGCDLAGTMVRVIDGGDAIVGEAELLYTSDGQDTITDVFTVKAPMNAGEYTWRAVYPAQECEGIRHDASETPFSFSVRPHSLSLSVWGIPFPVARGGKFPICVSASCTAGCSLANLPFTICGDRGEEVFAGRLGADIKEGTASTYWAALELNAPDDEALHKWTYRCALPESDHPHTARTAPVSFRTDAPPEHTLEIKIVDGYENRPLEDANVMVGFYKAQTDARGIARICVPGGTQELRVSKENYVPHNALFSIDRDQTIEVGLLFQPML